MALPLTPAYAHIEEVDTGTGIQPRVARTGHKVKYIALWHERDGMSVDDIADGYGLTLSEIHAALAYYFDHREEIDARVADDEAFEAELRKGHRSKLLERLASLA